MKRRFLLLLVLENGLSIEDEGRERRTITITPWITNLLPFTKVFAACKERHPQNIHSEPNESRIKPTNFRNRVSDDSRTIYHFYLQGTGRVKLLSCKEGIEFGPPGAKTPSLDSEPGVEEIATTNQFPGSPAVCQ